ncbi:MAG: hypothetical protein IAG13_19960 [Deltaproteobacteria bacterium]|nr:hypothetical protein [Nannocystaceae bacterium]
MKTIRFAWMLPLAACATESKGDGGSEGASGIASLTSAGPGETGGSDASASGTGPGGTADDDDGDGPGDGPKFDTENPGYCAQRDPGIYCNAQNYAVTCDADGEQSDSVDCNPAYCVEGVGCVECLAGQYTCMGDSVMMCNDAANPPAWQLVEVCDPGAGEGCDLGLGTCAVLQVLGSEVPTGEYYQFADFTTGSTEFRGGYDVDSFEDKLYVLYQNAIDVYQVTLLDSDADGALEPNQHPDNPEMAGPIEQRTITYIETIPQFGTPSASVSEVLALDDRVYIGGSQLTEYIYGGATTMISSPPGFIGNFSQIGYDDVNQVWYASQESQRRVFQRNETTGAWGIAFLYPNLAGDHMDGLEVVTDPESGIPYVYVSDMTSDFIGQYRLDPEVGWVQENLFSYVGTAGALVEGMGFGALNHFWATGGNSVYELGGGDLSEYTEPPG